MRSMFFFRWICGVFIALVSACSVLLLGAAVLCRSPAPVKWIGTLSMIAFLCGACICGVIAGIEKTEKKILLAILTYFSYIAVWLSLHMFFSVPVSGWYHQLLWIILGGVCCFVGNFAFARSVKNESSSRLHYRNIKKRIRR